MTNRMNVGVIQCRESDAPYRLINNIESNNFHIKKVFIKSNFVTAEEDYPDAEFVQDKSAIINDGSIDLVIISSPGNEGMDIVSEALGAGKSVRIL